MNLKCALTAVVVVISGCHASFARGRSSIAFPQAGQVKQIIQQDKTGWMITGNQVLRSSKGGIDAVYSDPDGILDAARQGDELYLATRKGLKRFTLGDQLTQGKTSFPNQEISCLALDDKMRLWVGSMHQGAYVQAGPDSFELKLQIPSILSMAATPNDTNVWIGTNVGLYRLGTGAFSYTRYAEEGYSGYELPDNVVEHVFADDLTNVWVLMPDNISFKKGSGFQGELPSFGFIGERGNAIHSILAVGKDWYLFVTEKGVSYMPVRALQDEHQHATEEVHEAHNTQSLQAKPAMLGCPQDWATEPVLRAQKAGNQIWFVTAKGCWNVNEGKLSRSLKG